MAVPSGPRAVRSRAVIRALVSRVPGRFSVELGLDLRTCRGRDLFLWFLAALLYGARISGAIATRTYAEFVRCGLTSPEMVVRAGWERLVEVLDKGGYTRYDYKTATKLLRVMESLIEQYGGDLQRLHDVSCNVADLERRLKGLGKGIGEMTVQIFLRELRGIWPKARPALSPLGILAARDLALCPSSRSRDGRPSVDLLRTLWKKAGVRGRRFSDFESALVRLGRDYCRRRRKEDCPMRDICASRQRCD